MKKFPILPICIYNSVLKCLLLLLACAITHQSHVQDTVLEPYSRLIVQNNQAIHPLRRAVDGTASTSDVFCRLFGTTITTVTIDSPQRSMFAPNLPTPVRSLFSLVQARRDRPTPCPLFGGLGMYLCSPVVVDAHDSAHLVCVQCFTVSCGGTEDTSW